MQLIFFSGTTDEYLNIATTLHQQLGTALSERNASKEAGVQIPQLPAPAAGTDDECVDIREAERILTRLPLSGNMKNVLTSLQKAGDNTVTSSQLKSVNHHNSHEFRAMMGAFARRVATTAGKKAFFCKEWDSDKGEFLWKLPLSARLAIKSTRVLE